jgi:glycosyltransferase 2 family protein
MLARGGILVAVLWTVAALAGSAFLIWQRGFSGSIALHSPILLLAFVPAAMSYFLRLLRWHILLRHAGGKVRLLPSLCVQSIGFALGATPGRAGEVFKLYLLNRRWGTSAARGGAVLLFERLSDAVGLAAVAVLGGLLHSGAVFGLDLPLRQVAVTVGLVIVAIVVVWRVGGLSFLQRGRLRQWGRLLAEFTAANRDLLRGGAVPWAFALTVLARLCDSLAVLLVASSVGLALSFPQAAVTLGLGGLAGGISLLPGGIGAADATMTGLLMGMGAAASVALSITLIARTYTYWLWVAVGLANLALFYRGFKKGAEDADMSGLDPSQST